MQPAHIRVFSAQKLRQNTCHNYFTTDNTLASLCDWKFKLKSFIQHKSLLQAGCLLAVAEEQKAVILVLLVAIYVEIGSVYRLLIRVARKYSANTLACRTLETDSGIYAIFMANFIELTTFLMRKMWCFVCINGFLFCIVMVRRVYKIIWLWRWEF